MEDIEEWKPIEDYEDCYEISNLGNVRSKDRKSISYGKRLCERKGRILIPTSSKIPRYLMVDLCKEGKRKSHTIHRLVANAFIPNPENLPTIDHIDQNKLNNNVSNLRWASLVLQQANRGKNKNNTSGHKHIAFRTKINRWIFHKITNGKEIIKRFETLELAIAFRDEYLKTI